MLVSPYRSINVAPLPVRSNLSRMALRGTSRAKRVVVIGAGTAGLTVASCLKSPGRKPPQAPQQDIEVTAVEARGRLGGRICTEHFADGSAVDLGAAWVHGACRSNPIMAIVKACGAKLVETDWENDIHFEAVGTETEPHQSKQMDEVELKRSYKHFEALWQLFRMKQSADRREAKKGPIVDQSLMTTLRGLKSKAFRGIDELDKRSQLLLLSAISGETEHDYAATPDELSSTWWDIDDEFDGGHALWKAGYQQLIEHLAEGITVVLDAQVERIEWFAADAGDGPACAVSLRDGRRLEADFCVCTLPLGVLQRDQAALFRPPLPEAKLQALGRLGVGILEKVALRFERCFWESKDVKPHCIYRTPTSESRTLPAACEAPYWVSLRPVTGSNVLVAYFVTGAGRVMARLPEEEAVSRVLALLKSMFSPVEVDAANLLEAKKTAWAEDEWSCGGYSFLAVGATTQDRHALAEPVGPLHFAGEATHDRYPATVHGALLSGRRAASEILAKLSSEAKGYPK
ncbi:Lysine-specific histone demethylase 1-like 3 [Symbiodinium microadriaticum]|uniref:Amine oxidase n=1 Tax=Symbiodinium microadriaticum TaxID=2951 RepID=A0A1Q9CKN3_SYMMI|nr:Lysine-specific histone demethylase 1-like 3 [Symbiodinium microadriaticum]